MARHAMRHVSHILAACAALACTACAAAPPMSSSVIAVDVGHSKEHPGAISARGVPEFQFNANLAREVAAALGQDKMTVALIGADGAMTGLKERTTQARAARAGFFLSIHHDSVKPAYLKPWQWHGAEHQYADAQFSGFGLFVSRKNPRLLQSLRCASAIGARLQAAGFHHSTYHADRVLGEGREWADEKDGVYYYDNLVVLKTAKQPAVLLEAGVIANRDEEAALASAQEQEKMVRAVRAGLEACGAVAQAGVGQ
jgi:N-acetylmuramoyl-L-alanine amidase